MLGITVIAVGKLKEKFLTDACREYEKRLLKSCKLEIIEVLDKPAPENCSAKELEHILQKEGSDILSKIPKGSYVIPLCVEGSQKSSAEFAESVKALTQGGISHITFIIGGSNGLSDKVKSFGNFSLSFSKFTFPHMLMRVILLEQIYRMFTIIEGKVYHK